MPIYLTRGTCSLLPVLPTHGKLPTTSHNDWPQTPIRKSTACNLCFSGCNGICLHFPAEHGLCTTRPWGTQPLPPRPWAMSSKSTPNFETPMHKHNDWQAHPTSNQHNATYIRNVSTHPTRHLSTTIAWKWLDYYHQNVPTHDTRPNSPPAPWLLPSWQTSNHHVMEDIVALNIPNHKKQWLSTMRVYLCILMLVEITNHTGKEILPKYLKLSPNKHQCPLNQLGSTHQLLTQPEPSKQTWKLWKKTYSHSTPEKWWHYGISH